MIKGTGRITFFQDRSSASNIRICKDRSCSHLAYVNTAIYTSSVHKGGLLSGLFLSLFFLWMHVMHKLWHFWLNTLANYRMDHGLLHGKNKWRTKTLLNIIQLTCFRNQNRTVWDSIGRELLYVPADCGTAEFSTVRRLKQFSREFAGLSIFPLKLFNLTLALKLLYSNRLPVFLHFSWSGHLKRDCVVVFWKWNKGKDYFEG